MRIHVKLFSVARDIAGYEERVFDVEPQADGQTLFARLVAAHPALDDWKGSVRLAVNCEYVPLTRVLKEGDEVAVIPPVSGG